MTKKISFPKIKRNTFVSILALSILVLASPLAVSAYTSPNHISSHTRVGTMGVFASSLPQNVLNKMLASTSKGGNSIPSELCSIPSGDLSTGIFASGKKAAFVEDWSTGNLFYCTGDTATLVADAPSGLSSYGYFGMGGVKTSSGVDLLLISWNIKAGWYCMGATSTGCVSQTSFVLPTTFCASEPSGSCTPDGVVLSKSMAFTYVDVNNAQMVSCKASATACVVDPASSAFSGYLPVGLTFAKGTFYATDESCTGNVWSGTKSSMSSIAQVGDLLEGVAVSKHNVGKVPELYIGDTGFCTGNPMKIVDLTDGGTVPTGATGSTEVVGISTALQFTMTDQGTAWVTADTS